MVLPNFLIVGAPKCATTSLYGHLAEHKDVFVSSQRKEGRFFSEIGCGKVFWPKNYPYPCPVAVEEYEHLFTGYEGQRLIGDVSPDYFAYADLAIPNILKHCGAETKIIVLVRDPIERTFSHYLQNVRRGAEHFSFAKALEIEPIRARDNWGFQWLYTGTSFYAARIAQYKAAFEHVLIVSKHDLDTDQVRVLRDIYDFLEIDFKTPIKVPRLNTGGVQQDKIDTVLRGDFDGRTDEFLDKARYTGEEIKKGPAFDTSFDRGGKLIPLEVTDMGQSLYAMLEARFAPEVEMMLNEYGINLKQGSDHEQKTA